MCLSRLQTCLAPTTTTAHRCDKLKAIHEIRYEVKERKRQPRRECKREGCCCLWALSQQSGRAIVWRDLLKWALLKHYTCFVEFLELSTEKRTRCWEGDNMWSYDALRSFTHISDHKELTLSLSLLLVSAFFL